MAATVHVLARFAARPGQETALTTVLTALVPPTRREIGCFQYDLLVDMSDPRQFCVVERWDSARALDRHLDSAHVLNALERMEGMLESPPDIRRFSLV
jgi:quinol monooxygenase YgiN